MKCRGLVLLTVLIVLVACGACGQDRIEVRPGKSADYNQAALLTAVDKFVAAGRTPEAYRELSQTAFALRPGMDRTVASEAELKLIVLALTPVQAVQARPVPAQADALALAVWPTLLAPVFEADDLLVSHDPKAAQTIPRSGEDVRAYILRLCAGPLVSECKQVVPEFQSVVVASIAIRRATERVRNAVSDCVMCGADPGWHEAVRAWEALDRMANGSIDEIQRRADPDNWPVAGGAAEPDPGLPEAEVNAIGEVVIGGQRYPGSRRIAALRELRGASKAIALHLRPELSLAQLRVLLDDVRRSGATRVAVVARTAHYPWDRRIYWITNASSAQAELRATDSLQLLLRAIDAHANVN